MALDDEDEPLAAEIARGLAGRIGTDLNLPVFLYGHVATDPDRARPMDFRRVGPEELEHLLEEGELVPDAGPPRLHPTAGAVLVGVRPPLIALNVWLPEGTLTDARAIAARVRETGGGPPGVRALGLYLPEAGMAQVSMNIEDRRAAPPAMVVPPCAPRPSAWAWRPARPSWWGSSPATPSSAGPRPPPSTSTGSGRGWSSTRTRRRGTSLAKKKKRKCAGPPPVTASEAPVGGRRGRGGRHEAPVQKRKSGEPVPPSFRGVLLRAGIIAVLFVPYLIYATGSDPGPSVLISLVALALMIPLGLLLDRFRYRRQLRRWEERRAARAPGR